MREKWCAKIAMALSAVLFSSACVSTMAGENYRPMDENRMQTFYTCEQQATAPAAGAAWNAYGGAVAVGNVTNSKVLYDCMAAKNYRLRKATTGEVWFQLLTSPFWIALDLFGAGIGRDMQVGDVADEQ